MRKFVRAGLTALLVCAVVAVQAPAQASHEVDSMMPTQTYRPFCYGADIDNGMVCQTDNADVYWYADSNDPGELEDNDVASLRDMLADQYSPTDLAIHYDSSPVFSGTAQTDIVYQESEAALPLPSGYRGMTWCNDDVGSEAYECDQQYVRIQSPDGYRIFGGGLACHETGHAVGLLHGSEAYPVISSADTRLGCMMNGVATLPSGLGSDQVHQINLTY
jgi:hypothetical protein